MIHSWATDKNDTTEQPRWGVIGKQKIEDAGPLNPKRMETVDDEILDLTLKFIDKAKQNNKPFFVWLNPTRMHVVTHLSEKYDKMRTPENGWSEEEAGMAQLDDIVGAVMQKLKDAGLDDNTMRFSTSLSRHSVPCVSTTTSTALSTSPAAGWVGLSKSTGQSSSISVSIHSNVQVSADQ